MTARPPTTGGAWAVGGTTVVFAAAAAGGRKVAAVAARAAWACDGGMGGEAGEASGLKVGAEAASWTPTGA